MATTIDDVDRYRVMEPLFEGVRVVMSRRGESYSPAYIQGISGAAFRIAGICPCAPTCSNTMHTQHLVTLLGYEMDYLPLYGEDAARQAEMPRVLERVKAEVDAGRPALVWNAFTTCEWDVVCGYDDDGQFYGRGSYKGLDAYAMADETRAAGCGDICPELGAILIGEKLGALNSLAAEMAALREAVRHARSQNSVDKLGGEEWVMLDGLACYDRWVRDFASGPPYKAASMGDRYCFGVYRSTHREAARFLRELAAKYATAEANLLRAAECFTLESSALNEAAERLFPGWSLPERADAGVNRRVHELLAAARDQYALAIDEIELALGRMV